MLEAQQAKLVLGIRELHRRCKNAQGATGEQAQHTSNGSPSTHEILDSLGILKPDGQTTPEPFEEDTRKMQATLFANGPALLRQESSDTSSDIETPLTVEESFPPRSSNHFRQHQQLSSAHRDLPSTYPDLNPHTNLAWSLTAPAKMEMPPHMEIFMEIPQPRQHSEPWPLQSTNQSQMQFEGGLEVLSVDRAMDTLVIQAPFQSQHQALCQAQAGINPCLTMKDWAQQQQELQYSTCI